MGEVSRDHDQTVSVALDRQDKGPVQLLCEEIGFPFQRRLERRDVFIASVGALVEEIGHMRAVEEALAGFSGVAPSEGSGVALGLARAMIAATDPVSASEAVHDACHELNPDDAYPTDHAIDMVSSCASAIRFGLETPCRSRHAASAANHVWKRKYGIRLFDSSTGAWENSWAAGVLMGAIVGLLPPLCPPLSSAKPKARARSRDALNPLPKHTTEAK